MGLNIFKFVKNVLDERKCGCEKRKRIQERICKRESIQSLIGAYVFRIIELRNTTYYYGCDNARTLLRIGENQKARYSLKEVLAREVHFTEMMKRFYDFIEVVVQQRGVIEKDLKYDEVISLLREHIMGSKYLVDFTPDFCIVEDWSSIFERSDHDYYARVDEMMEKLGLLDPNPWVEEMMANLEKEVVAEVNGGKTVNKTSSASLSEGIGEGCRKLKELMEKK